MKKIWIIVSIVVLGLVFLFFGFVKGVFSGRQENFGRENMRENMRDFPGKSPFFPGNPPAFDQTGVCKQQFPDKFRFHQEREGKMEQIDKNTNRIISVAESQGYDTTKLKTYQRQLIEYKKQHPLPIPCLTGSELSGGMPLPPTAIKDIVDNMQQEFEQVKSFMEAKRKSQVMSFWQRIVNFFRR